ncbi:MAG: hypothetical protein ACLUN0_04665 [Roseburia sp.]
MMQSVAWMCCQVERREERRRKRKKSRQDVTDGKEGKRCGALDTKLPNLWIKEKSNQMIINEITLSDIEDMSGGTGKKNKVVLAGNQRQPGNGPEQPVIHTMNDASGGNDTQSRGKTGRTDHSACI